MPAMSWLPWISKQKIVLASASPRRHEILTDMGVDFQVVTTLKDDANDPTAFELKEDYVEYTARMKAVEVFERCRDDPSLPDADIVIGADTVVVLDDNSTVLEKPRDADDAKRMLRTMSGKQHTAMTGVVILRKSSAAGDGGGKPYHEISFVSKTDVEFSDIDDGLLEAYVASGQAFGKSGAYGLQGTASLFVKGIHGDYWNVVGLPKNRLYQELLTLERLMERKDIM
ncbi:acetylserotonin O-methyltransferase-like protein [Zychaea mexicana]|uniref:acetylserotonin O-methyltransferase-like protein n=1 Tax=Zychaea mexicana TaxID=64656 RepID=UPI0022FDE635|nr:acetylserotonin O-methyltransferase-like protein [Zychaea mexicana]KAI9496445.1 acetylserotonin O-methyltransferase-like protein [Zychaea mexicana]